MISILIPAFNFDVTRLVFNLEKQGDKLHVPYEIRVYEDGSEKAFVELNRELNDKPNIVYKVLGQNLGRSKIRNLMSKEAKYDIQLFMDCDSAVYSLNYLSTYLSVAKSKAVIFGGRAYSIDPPENRGKYLRWKYGEERESTPAETRKTKPYKYFMTNNFLVNRSVIEQVPFDKSLQGYGHEDTMFALDLEGNGIPVEHINNPLIHIGLEDAAVFLAKTRQGIKNLSLLIRKGKMTTDNTLYKTYLNLKRWGCCGITNRILKPLRNRFERNLVGKRPALWMFDLYKLSYLLEEMNAQDVQDA